MASTLKRVNLMLDEAVVEKLREAADERRVSMSEMARSLLARDLGLSPDRRSVADRIRQLREQIGDMPDSAEVIRRSRDAGW